MSHTPRPWQINGIEIHAVEQGAPDGLRRIAVIDQQNKQRYDNARLIVAAPDLLEACKLALDYLIYEGERPRPITAQETGDSLKQAISKAKGK